jgi:hypothetical protein
VDSLGSADFISRFSGDAGTHRPSTRRCSTPPVIMIGMPTAEIYTLVLAGLLVGGVLWVVSRFTDRD